MIVFNVVTLMFNSLDVHAWHIYIERNNPVLYIFILSVDSNISRIFVPAFFLVEVALINLNIGGW